MTGLVCTSTCDKSTFFFSHKLHYNINKVDRIITALVQYLILNLSHPCLKLQAFLIDLFSSVLTATELEFSEANLQSMVSILDSLHRFTFQFIKNSSAAM